MSPPQGAGTRPLRVCHVVYAFYESDSRVRMYAEASVGRGDQVEVVSLRKPGQKIEGLVEGVKVHRIQERIVDEHGSWDYLRRILKFFMLSARFLSCRCLSGDRCFDLVHVHSVPDFEVFAAVAAKLRGAKVILDIHDLVPEFYAGKFGAAEESLVFRSLLLAEKVSTAFADHVITANHLWEKTLIRRAVPKEKCSTFLNYPAPAFFRKYPRDRRDGKIRMIYPGTLNRHQGVDIAVRALDLVRNEAPEAELYIYGEGPDRPFLEKMVTDLSLSDRVFIRNFLPLEKIIPIVADADIGIVPKRAEGFGDTAFSTKILEFMALGVPVIVAKTTIDRYYFDETLVEYFTPGSPESLAEAMLRLIERPQRRASLVANATNYVRKNSWQVKKSNYLRLVDDLAGAI